MMDFTNLDAFLAFLERERGKAGTDCVVYMDGKQVYRRMNGWADIEHGIPISDKTLYRMFSMTKPITCLAMMQLYEQGKFLLTDPVKVYLPEFTTMQVAHRQPSAPADITMRQLFTMTSGLTYDLETPYLRELYAKKPDFTTREFVQAVSKAQLAFNPGEKWLYSLAHDVLAAVVEVLSGQKFSDYVNEHIFKPLGISDWYFWVPQDQIARSCVRYHVENGKLTRDEGETDTMRWNMYQRSPNHESGGAGLTTTVDEYAKFARMLTRLGVGDDGTRIVSASTLNLMRQNQLDDRQLIDFNWVQFAGYGYGLGVRTMMSPAMSGSAGSVGEYGWGGAAGTYFLSDPTTGLTVVYAQQATPNDEVYVHPRLRNIIYAAIGK